MTIVLFLVVLFLAATNDANDNFKGVATLYGSRRAGDWTSLGWASITTLAGSLCSVFLAQALLETFTGAGLMPPDDAAQIPRRDRGRRTPAALDAAERALFAYAVKLTHAPATMERNDIAALRAVDFADQDILLANLVVAYFNFVNRIALGLGVGFDESELHGYPI
ncbi:MAG: hypothetical protein ABIY40_08335 [Rhodanobacteraceae bacterium]|nr:hypothetical protein [Pseudomonadota bacterium]